MNNRLYISLAGAMLLLVAMCGCIKNDLPYGKVPLSITAFSVSGQTGDAVISDKDLTVTVNLEETANPAKSELLNIEYKATLRDGSDDSYNNNIESSVKKGDVLDLTNDFDIKLSLFQEYNWKIVPVQNIERVFKVANQMGKPVFDAEQKMAVAYIQKDLPLSGAELKELKLGPQGCEQSGVSMGVVSQENGWKFYKNYIEAFVTVKFSDFIDETWSIRIYNFDQDMTKAANPGVRVAWLYGIGMEGQTCGFEYRKADDTEWTAVPSSDIEMDGTDFSTVLTDLTPETKYVCRAKVGDIEGGEVEFTTLGEVEIPNMGFENWSQEGKVICPWAEGEETFWDTGNKGSTTVSENDNITMGVNEPRPGSSGSTAAKLESKAIVGVMAAGNLFIGKYKETQGMNGLLGFGRTFQTFPTKLTGYYKYTQATIDKTSKGYEHLQGQPDTGIIWVALVSGNPDSYGTYVEVKTDNVNNNGKYFDKDADNVLAYGEMNINETVSEYKKFEIELEYRRTDVVPSGILIVCSASKLGDYFTGGVGSTLWVDDFALEYDY